MIEFSQIISRRRETLKKEKIHRPLTEIKDSIKRVKIRKNFKKSLQKNDDVSVICEYKPASPSAGEISGLTVEDVLPQFEKGGASAASIITEETFFKSSIDNLKVACKISKLPLLRKDFILDEYHIYQSRASGASAILLIANIYPNLSEGILLAHYLGMDALVECKNRKEIKMAIDAGAEIIGINNRSFEDFTINYNRTLKLGQLVPPEIILVSESGVKSPADVKLLSSYGADALLVGTSVMGSQNIASKVGEIVGAAEDSRIGRI